MLSLGDKSLSLDQLLGGLRGEERQQHRSLRPASRELLAHHLPGLTLHFLGGDIGSSHLGDYAAGRRACQKSQCCRSQELR